jgi:apolipoprotein D and lipocalin family protein
MTPKIPLAAILLVGLVGCASPSAPVPVASVDLKKYEGTWYEVARIPNVFQRRCASGTTAEYSSLPDGNIRVVNSCKQATGKRESITGTASVVPGSNNAKLKVRFFGPFAGNYWILGLDKNYRWALVGEPSRKFLWILSRTPRMTPETYETVLKLAAGQGYDVKKIVPSKP